MYGNYRAYHIVYFEKMHVLIRLPAYGGGVFD